MTTFHISKDKEILTMFHISMKDKQIPPDVDKALLDYVNNTMVQEIITHACANAQKEGRNEVTPRDVQVVCADRLRIRL